MSSISNNIYTVKPGDCMWGVIQKQAAERNMQLNDSEIVNKLNSIMEDNPHIKDASCIDVGMEIDLSSIFEDAEAEINQQEELITDSFTEEDDAEVEIDESITEEVIEETTEEAVVKEETKEKPAEKPKEKPAQEPTEQEFSYGTESISTDEANEADEIEEMVNVQKSINFDNYWMRGGQTPQDALEKLNSDLESLGLSADELLEKLESSVVFDEEKYSEFLENNKTTETAENRLLFLGNNGNNDGNGNDIVTFDVSVPKSELQQQEEAAFYTTENGRYANIKRSDKIRLSTADNYQYPTQELRSQAIQMQTASMEQASDTAITRNMSSLDANGNVIANQQYYKSDVVDGELSGMTIMVNAGHGGRKAEGGAFDPGAVTKDGVEEWIINQIYAEDLTEQLLAKGANVLLTQGQVSTLEECVNGFASEYGGADGDRSNLRIVSLHGNMNQNTSASGLAYYYYGMGSDLASDLRTAAQDDGLNVNYSSDKDLRILRAAQNNSVEATLVEVGFMSNPDELDRILTEDYENKVLGSIIDGLVADRCA